MRRAHALLSLTAAAAALAACSTAPEADPCRELVGDVRVVVDTTQQEGVFLSVGDSVQITPTVRRIEAARAVGVSTVTICDAEYGDPLPGYAPAFTTSNQAVVAARASGWLVGVGPGAAVAQVTAGDGVIPFNVLVTVDP